MTLVLAFLLFCFINKIFIITFFSDAAENTYWFQDPASFYHESLVIIHDDFISVLIFIMVFIFIIFLWILYFFAILKPQVHFYPALNSSILLEFIWTILPALFLLSILGPVLALIYSTEELGLATFTIKIVGHQWYWAYEFGEIHEYGFTISDAFFARYKIALYFFYVSCRGIESPEEPAALSIEASTPYARSRKPLWYRVPATILWRNWAWGARYEGKPYSKFIELVHRTTLPLSFESRIRLDADLRVGQLRLLEVDNRLVLPLWTHIRAIVTSTDVLHSWTVPSFGVKIDACPGRLNQIHLFVQRPGIFYGQCSEICGVNHAFMPICVEVL
jgi:heme/copper-type cytochrome/quinol oxidase subunit 2